MILLVKRKTGASTPAPKKDRIFGSRRNPKGSASGKGSITFSDSVIKSIRTVIVVHNAEVQKRRMADWRKINLQKAKAVVRRGFGAYSTSHRPNVSRVAWGLARLKAFSYLMLNDKPKNKNYITDNDLLPKQHKKSSKR